MAARKGSTRTKSGSRKKRPSNAKRKPKARHGAGPKALIEKASKTPGFQRKPSWGHYSYLTALMGRVERSAFGGFAPPQNAAEADVQIRTMGKVRANATRQSSKTTIERLLNGSGKAASPISDPEQLTLLAAERAVSEADDS